MQYVLINGRRINDDASDMDSVEIVVPATTLIPIWLEWCTVQMPATELLRTMMICEHGEDFVYVDEVSILDEIVGRELFVRNVS